MSFVADVGDKAVNAVDGPRTWSVSEVCGGDRNDEGGMRVGKKCWGEEEVRERGGEGHVSEAADEAKAE